MLPSVGGFVLVLSTVQAEVQREQVPHAPQLWQYHEISHHLQAQSSLKQPSVTASVFSQVLGPVAISVGFLSHPSSLPTDASPR